MCLLPLSVKSNCGFVVGIVLIAALESLTVTSTAVADHELVELWTYQGGDGEVFGESAYFPKGKSLARGVLVMPGLHRDDVEAFRVSPDQSILRVKQTDRCLMLFHYGTSDADDAHGVYSVRFAKGGNPFVTKQGVASQAGWGVKYLSRFRELKRLTLESRDIPADELKHLAKLTHLRSLTLRNLVASDDDLTALRGLPLESLTINLCPVTDAVLQSVATLRQLREFSLIETKVGPQGLAQLRDLPLLESLDLTGNPMTAAGVEELGKFTSLKILTLKNTPLNDSAVEALSKLAVVNLSIDGTQITSQGMRQLWESRPTVMEIMPPTLELRMFYGRLSHRIQNDLQARRLAAEPLVARGAKIEMQRGEFEKLLGEPDKHGPLPWMASISLRTAIKSDDDLSRMAPFVNSLVLTPKLIDLEETPIRGTGFRTWSKAGEELRLSGTQLDNEGLRFLSRVYFNRLRLDRTRITDEGTVWLPNGGRLHVLSLNHTRTADKTLEHLAQGFRGANLLELEMDHTGVTDAGLKNLEKFTSLKRLSLRQTSVTGEGVRLLQKWLPQCQVVTETK